MNSNPISKNQQIINKPIFIVGAGRSGSTAFHEIFCSHPQVAWLSSLCNKYRDNPSRNRLLMTLIDYPLVKAFLLKRTHPSECYDFWEHLCKGFRHPCRDLVSEDVTFKNKSRIYRAMSEMLTPKRNRLLIKITGWPRIGFLLEIFRDAKFIHIVRDGRAVSNSIINVDWWWGWRGPENWRWGLLKPAHQAAWEKHHKSFIALAGIQWNILMEAMDKAMQCLEKDNFLEIKYEDLCADKLGVFKKAIQFCELEWSHRFADSIMRHPLKNMNYKFKEELTSRQLGILNDIMQFYLQKYGYV